MILEKIFGKKEKKIVFYTAIFGNYDSLKEPPKKLLKNCDFICFTDNLNIKSNRYKIIYCKKDKNLGDHMQSRIYKILPYKYIPLQYKYSIWIDGHIKLKKFNIFKLIKKHLKKTKWLVFVHPQRNCIYEEALVCVKLKKDKKENINRQVSRYKKEGYPKNNGLVANGFILREHNDKKVIEVCDAWWEEMQNGSRRDQMSFCYVAWKKEFYYDVIDKNLWDNEYFSVSKHKKLIK